jgi:hypothetical protein
MIPQPLDINSCGEPFRRSDFPGNTIGITVSNEDDGIAFVHRSERIDGVTMSDDDRFFRPPYISAGQKHLTEEEEALKREVDPALAKLYASVYRAMESRILQHENLHSLAPIFDGHHSLIWIDDVHVTPVGNELIAEGTLRAVARRGARNYAHQR